MFLQKGYRSLHTAARKDFAKAAKLLLQKDHKPDIEAPVSLWTVLNFVNTIYTQSEARQKTCIESNPQVHVIAGKNKLTNGLLDKTKYGGELYSLGHYGSHEGLSGSTPKHAG